LPAAEGFALNYYLTALLTAPMISTEIVLFIISKCSSVFYLRSSR